MTLDGVNFPELPPYRQLRAFQHYLAAKYGLNVDLDGLSAYVDLEKALASDLIYNHSLGFFTLTPAITLLYTCKSC